MIPIRVLGAKVLVALEPKATAIESTTGMNYHDKGTSDAGIVLAQPTDMYDPDEHSRGLVVALGEKKHIVELETVKTLARTSMDFQDLFRRLDKLGPVPFAVSVGDVVLFSPAAGISLGEQDDGITYCVLQDTDIVAIIEPKVEAVTV